MNITTHTTDAFEAAAQATTIIESTPRRATQAMLDECSVLTTEAGIALAAEVSTAAGAYAVADQWSGDGLSSEPRTLAAYRVADYASWLIRRRADNAAGHTWWKIRTRPAVVDEH